ncbi:MAG TPA: hypothetical protein VFE62_03570 [Gemmataceae bacterium]|nr:hypothetical protein [Gemmataceae bacterium]
MQDHERVKLIAGPYRMPRCRIGGVLRCARYGKVIVRGITDAPIPWPYTWVTKYRHPTLILCGDLARAVRTESGVAIKHHFGVGDYLIWQWRKALGVEITNDGTSALRSRWGQEEDTIAQLKEARRSPKRAAKIAAARRGKPRPRHVIEAMRRANLGRKASASARAKMSAAHKRRGTRPPAAGPAWSAEDDALLGTMLDREVSRRIGRSERAVVDRRRVLGVAPFTKRSAPRGHANWSPAQDRLLGTMPDVELARKLRCSPMSVFYRRRKLGITRYRG